ncbi:TetR/AcrR family transcriptional regulator [Sphaerimonospora thailandensis]|uniref:TetR family transcriptional regulator n=1 Tax=Sphaerimonospora thailandensis TaxID=795644 RepID=A0A8J3R9T1_9ACTN|nr:TetR/AcrR family transcriptional regulator [Sphaerimonospora thailandensis]GIH70915.1 TetR family transcriptional regulator [Sphaerimonospora thailandensis]
MARAGLSADAIVDLALQIIDEEGPDAVKLSAVAGRAGVATPSLYKHVRNIAELNTLVAIRVMNELADQLREAALGRSRDEAVRAFMNAWRGYAQERPGRYAALIQTPRPELAEAGERLVDLALAVLRAYGLEGQDALHATRCIRAAVHGFAVLESAGAFGLPLDLDDSYELLTQMIITMLCHSSPQQGR